MYFNVAVEIDIPERLDFRIATNYSFKDVERLIDFMSRTFISED